MRTLLVGFLLIATPVFAQNKPGKFTTLTTTDTSADSVHVGCAVGSSTCTGGIKAGPGVFSGAVNVNSVTTGNKVLTLGGSPADSSAVFINLLSSNSQLNWRISTNTSVPGALEFTPSTAAGGSTFTTAAMTIGPTGIFNFGGKYGIAATGDLTIGASAAIFYSTGTPSIVLVGPPSSFEGGSLDANTTDSAITMTWGASGSGNRSGTITFGHTFSHAPIPMISTNSVSATCRPSSVSTTQIALFCTATIAAGDKVWISAWGY